MKISIDNRERREDQSLCETREVVWVSGRYLGAAVATSQAIIGRKLLINNEGDARYNWTLTNWLTDWLTGWLTDNQKCNGTHFNIIILSSFTPPWMVVMENSILALSFKWIDKVVIHGLSVYLHTNTHPLKLFLVV